MSQGQMALLKWLLRGAFGGLAMIILAVTPLSAHTARGGFWPFSTSTDEPAEDFTNCVPVPAAGAAFGDGANGWSGAGSPVAGPSPNGDDTVGAPDNGSLPQNDTVAKGHTGTVFRGAGAVASGDLPPGIRDIPGMAGDLPHVIWHVFGAPAGSDIGPEQERKFIRDGWQPSPQKAGQNKDLVANEPATKLCGDGACPAAAAPKGAQGVTGSTTGTSGT